MKTNPKVESMDDYEVHEDLRAVARAHAVKKDPARMKAVKVLAKTKIEENQRKKDEAQHAINLGQEKK